jgi:hypothetical protein
MKLRRCRILFSIAFEVEVLGVLIALLPVGVDMDERRYERDLKLDLLAT